MPSSQHLFNFLKPTNGRQAHLDRLQATFLRGPEGAQTLMGGRAVEATLAADSAIAAGHTRTRHRGDWEETKFAGRWQHL
jgi:hypothetical protein